MRKKCMLTTLVGLLLTINNGFAQVYPFVEDFEAMTSFQSPAGWGTSLPGFQVYPTHGVGGSKGMTKELTQFSTSDSVISPLVGPLTALSNVSMKYRIVESSLYPSTPHAMGLGDAIILSAQSIILPFPIQLLTVDYTNHVADTAWSTMQFAAGQLAGQIGNLIIQVTRGNGDFFVDFDEFSVADASSVADVTVVTDKALIYPNPSHNGMQLQLKGVEAGSYKATVVTAEGIETALQNVTVTDKTSALLNTSQLNRGTYFLRLNSAKHNYLLKFIVNN